MKNLKIIAGASFIVVIFGVFGLSTKGHAQKTGAQAVCMPISKNAGGVEQTINKMCDVSATFSMNDNMLCCVKK